MRSASVAFFSLVLAFSWDWTVVHTIYGSNWTGLFCEGSNFNRPAELEAGTYVFRNSSGYDGQFYRLIAQDPLFTRHYDTYVDAPRLRYRRILQPGLAALLAAVFAPNRPASADGAYIGLTWLFVALGTFCLAELAVAAGRSPWWGMLFLVTPATLIALDRMTVDIGLTALSLAAVLAAIGGRWVLLWFVLAGALLSKETGILVVCATLFWLVRQRRILIAAALSTSVLPGLAWYGFGQSHTRGDYSMAGYHFITAFFAALKEPLGTGAIPFMFRVATLVAVFGMLWAAINGIAFAWQDRFQDLALLICLLFSVFAVVFQTSDIWLDPYSFPRVYSPLLVTLIAGRWNRPKMTLIPLALVLPPVGMQFAVPLVGRLIHG
jgi:hypothetical protein